MPYSYFRLATQEWDTAQSTGEQNDSQTKTKSHYIAGLLLSSQTVSFVQSKYESASSQIAHNARAGRDSATMAQAPIGARPARIDAQAQRFVVAGDLPRIQRRPGVSLAHFADCLRRAAANDSGLLRSGQGERS